MITDPAWAAAQVLEMVQEGTVTTVSGTKIPIVAETICLHGDGPHVLEFATTIHRTLKEKGIDIRSS
jgi:5-oxoprolinase (ATP-hydrolysing) subunit A